MSSMRVTIAAPRASCGGKMTLFLNVAASLGKGEPL